MVQKQHQNSTLGLYSVHGQTSTHHNNTNSEIYKYYHRLNFSKCPTQYFWHCCLVQQEGHLCF